MGGTLFTEPIFYYIWLLSLTFAVSSALLLLRLGITIRKSLVGQLIFSISLAYTFWIISQILHSFIHDKVEFLDWFAVIALFTGSLIGLYVAYIGFKVHDLLEIHEKKILKFRIQLILIFLGISMGIFGSIRFLFNNSFMNEIFEGLSVQEGLIFILIGIGTVFLFYREDRLYLPKIFGVIAVVVATVTWISVWFNIEMLYMPFFGVGFSAPSAATVIALGLILIFYSKTDNYKILIFIVILLSLIFVVTSLALIGYITQNPELYSPHYLAKLSLSTVIVLYSYSLVIMVSLWKKV